MLAAVFLLVATSCGTAPAASVVSAKGLVSGVPGTFENAAPAGLPAVIALNNKLNPSDDELVIYYIRSDKAYEPWALWLWALPGGDGATAWPNTQNWKVEDGIGYMRFKLDGSDLGTPPVGSSGQLGLIVRQKGGWTKDGDDDRVFDSNVSNVIAIFSGDDNTYAAKEYKPKALSATLASQTEIQVLLSGRYGLDKDGGSSGFTVESLTGKKYPIARVVNAESPNNTNYNYARRVIITLGEPVQAADALLLKNAVFEGDKQIDGTQLAVEMANSTVPAKTAILGAEYTSASKSVSFTLWAPTSSSALVNLYKKDLATKPDYSIPMILDSKTGVWSATFKDVDPDGFFYDFTLANAKGSVTVLDPYAKSMAAYRNTGGSGRAAIIDMNSPRALPAAGMNANYVSLKQREDAVIYEMSVRDFTISPDSDVMAPKGTYKAFIEKIPYLQSLGITHVQLMPVVNFYFTDETDQRYEDSGTVSNNNYNWGYDPHNYFTPEGWFSSDPTDPYSRVAELRELINECHKAGIGVLLDVVYNHMANTTFLDDIVPGYFFRTNAQGKFTSNSGCGNDVATERGMARKLIVDSVHHWVSEYKIDGFRFDLMGLMDSKTVLDAYAVAKTLNPDVLFEGEGWKMYNGEIGTVGMDQAYMTKTDSVSVFNDEIRDLLKAGGFNEAGRGFLTKQGPDTNKLFKNLLGQPQANYKADDPGDNLQYLVAHDGLTLHDSITHNAKLDPSDPAQKIEIAKRIRLGNFMLMTSQGVAFMHGGQERGRTKPNFKNSQNESVGNFVRNSYDSSDSINQIIWKLDSEQTKIFSHMQGMIALRRAFDVFRIGDMAKINAAATLLSSPEENRLALGYSLDWTDGTWFVLANAENKTMTFSLPVDASGATVFADSNYGSVKGIAKPEGLSIEGKAVSVAPLTGIVLRVKK